MFTRLYPVNDENQITFFMTQNDEIRQVLGEVTEMVQTHFRCEAFKLFRFASRLGLEGTLTTSLRMPKGNRVITVSRVTRDQYRIDFKTVFGIDCDHFIGTERELRKQLHQMRKNGVKILHTEHEMVVADGYQFGSADVSGANPYTFGTVWADRIEGKPQLILRMLKTLSKCELVLSSAKDDLLERAAEKFEYVA